jgi:hypothetical protein
MLLRDPEDGVKDVDQMMVVAGSVITGRVSKYPMRGSG